MLSLGLQHSAQVKWAVLAAAQGTQGPPVSMQSRGKGQARLSPCWPEDGMWAGRHQ